MAGAPPTLDPPPGDPRFPLLDSMRGLAALSVVVYHVAFFSRATEDGVTGALLSHLNLGVVVFFLISGFVLYRPMVRARWEGAAGQPVRTYARRRLLRIVPAYWLALTVLAITPGLAGVFTGDWWIYYGFGQVYSTGTFLKGIGPAWSLCTELAFYAVLPLLAAGLGRAWRGGRERGVRLELAALAGLGLASFALRAALELRGLPTTLSQTLLGTFDAFALGMALAVLSVALAGRAAPALVRRAGLCWGLALGAYAAIAAVGGPDPPFLLATGRPAGEAIAIRALGLLAAVLLLLPAIFATGAPAAVRRALAHPALAWLGLVSYGVYLWHYPIVQRVAVGPSMTGLPGGNGWRIAAIALPIVLACAAVSYYALERPLARRRR